MVVQLKSIGWIGFMVNSKDKFIANRQQTWFIVSLYVFNFFHLDHLGIWPFLSQDLSHKAEIVLVKFRGNKVLHTIFGLKQR